MVNQLLKEVLGMKNTLNQKLLVFNLLTDFYKTFKLRPKNK